VTELLYYQDSYCKEFQASIISVDSSGKQVKVELDQTAFYPGGGGQPYDEGWLHLPNHTFRVSKVKREKGKMWHYIEGDAQESAELLRAGMSVKAELDWERRYKIMRTHTAMHILCGVVWRDYGASVTGGNMDPGRGRMDFEFETMQRELVEDIERKCNEEVLYAKEIWTQTLPREEALKIPDLIRTKINLLPKGITEVRTVEIQGLDLQADGGTHVQNTKEVGQIRVTDYKSKGAINKRIYLEIV
jgi:misacylated tRNA(Ala) deacylase